MSKKHTQWLPLFLVVLALSGCSAVIKGGDPLNGTSWLLESLGDQMIQEERAPTLKFMDGRVTGSGGCNSYQGGYSISDGQIQFKELTMTLMACPDGGEVMNLEQDYFNAIQVGESFELDGNRLSIYVSDGRILDFAKK
jgi:heat shock protein HslJ